MPQCEIGCCHPLRVFDLGGNPQGFLDMCKPSAKFSKGGQSSTRRKFDVGLARQRVHLTSQVQPFRNVAETGLKALGDAIRCFSQIWAGVRYA